LAILRMVRFNRPAFSPRGVEGQQSRRVPLLPT